MTTAAQMSMEFMMGDSGYFVKKRNPLFEAIVPVATNPEMPTIDISLKYFARRIPGPKFNSWRAFCRAVSKRHSGWGSEAALLLLYEPELKEWDAIAPEMDLNAVHVDYTGVWEALDKFRKKRGKKWMPAGTLHSHPGDAFPSSTDKEDERKMDGIHLIIPDFGARDEGYVAHIAASGQRFSVTKMHRLIDLDQEGEEPFPKEWMDAVKFGTGSRKDKFYQGSDNIRTTGSGRNKTVIVEVEREQRKMNIMLEKYDQLDTKDALKFVGFSKTDRKKLEDDNDEDLRQYTIIFDNIRQVVKDITDIRGPASHEEKKALVGACVTAIESVFDSIKIYCDDALGNGETSSEDPAEEEAAAGAGAGPDATMLGGPEEGETV